MDEMNGDSYRTPKWILDIFDNWFDPCPFNPNPTFDGLSIEWKDGTYVNPPYSNPLPWVRKAILENKQGKRIALLLKLDCSTRWFKELMESESHILFVNERIKFNKGASPFPNAIFILDRNAISTKNEVNSQHNSTGDGHGGMLLSDSSNPSTQSEHLGADTHSQIKKEIDKDYEKKGVSENMFPKGVKDKQEVNK